jgi:hypothetical protein
VIPSTRQLVALVALVVVAVGGFLGVYALTPLPARPDLIAHVLAALPGGGALVAGVLAWLGVRSVRADQADHGVQLAKITHQTNGVLSQRIADVVADQLDKRGLVVNPSPSPDDPAPIEPAAIVPAQRVDESDQPAPVLQLVPEPVAA